MDGMSKEKLTIDSIMSMRSKDLRNILIQIFNQDRAYITKIIDKAELRDLALKLFINKNSKEEQYALMYRAGAVSLLLLVLLLVLINYQAIRSSLTYKRIWKTFKKMFYKQRKRFKMIVYSFHEQAYIVCSAFLLAMIGEIYCALIQLTTSLSWIIPSHIYYYRFRLPSLSMPLSTSMLLPAKLRDQHQGFGLDLGPMVTIWGLIWIVNQLDNYGAAGMSKVMAKKDTATWSSRSTSFSTDKDNKSAGKEEDKNPDDRSHVKEDIPHRAAAEELTQEEIDFILKSEMALHEERLRSEDPQRDITGID